MLDKILMNVVLEYDFNLFFPAGFSVIQHNSSSGFYNNLYLSKWKKNLIKRNSRYRGIYTRGA
jgi:hypothetical protein